MPMVPIENIGQLGVIKDTEPVLLPPNAFTDALNVRFRDGSVETIPGESLFASIGAAPSYGIHWPRPDGAYNVFIKDGSAVAVNASGSATSILTGSYPNSRWQLDNFGGGYSVYINNGVSTPLYVLVGSETADLSFQEFPGWNYNDNTVTAKVVRSLGYSLVAANLTITDAEDNVTYAPVTVRISVQAAIGNFPTIWEPGLTTDTADEFEVNSTTPIVDMKELRGSMFIYTSNSIHLLNIQNGVPNVKPYAKGYGVLSLDCIAEFEGKHLVVDRNDIYYHNGSGEIKSAVEQRWRNYFIENLNPTHASNTFVVTNPRYSEIWVCFPNLSSTGKCNEALIYNYRTDTWTRRQLPNVTYLFQSPPIFGGSFVNGKTTLIGCNGTTQTLLMDSGYQMYNGTALANYTSYLERKYLLLKEPSGDSRINSMSPTLKVTNPDATVYVRVKSTNVYNDDVDLSVSDDTRDTFSIQPQNTQYGYKVDPREQGRFISYRIFSTDYWKLSAQHVDAQPNVNRR